MNTDFSKEILDEIETAKIISFCQDRIMFEAVKKYLLVYLYQDGVALKGEPHKGNVNWALSLAFNANAPAQYGGVPRTNEELGADLRAKAQAVQIVESGFKELLEIKAETKTEEVVENPAE